MNHPSGVTIRRSSYTVKETIDRLQAELQAHGATIYARIDQQGEMKKAGQDTAPLEFLLFGNPKAGAPVMMDSPIAALDLPLKAIAWQEDDQAVYIAYNDAAYIKDRYNLPAAIAAPLNIEPVITKILS